MGEASWEGTGKGDGKRASEERGTATSREWKPGLSQGLTVSIATRPAAQTLAELGAQGPENGTCLTLGLPHVPVPPRSQASPPTRSPSLQSKKMSLKGESKRKKGRIRQPREKVIGIEQKSPGKRREAGPGLGHSCQGKVEGRGIPGWLWALPQVS